MRSAPAAAAAETQPGTAGIAVGTAFPCCRYVCAHMDMLVYMGMSCFLRAIVVAFLPTKKPQHMIEYVLLSETDNPTLDHVGVFTSL